MIMDIISVIGIIMIISAVIGGGVALLVIGFRPNH